MTTEGIEAVFLETHNWGKTARFFQALGFDLEFETDHSSGLLRNGAEEAPGVVVGFAGAGVEVVSPFAETHFGTREMTVRDPDGRLWSLQAKG